MMPSYGNSVIRGIYECETLNKLAVRYGSGDVLAGNYISSNYGMIV